MSPASVTLASALQVRDEALSEEEIWSLLSLAAEQLLEDLCNDSSDYIVCPWTALLSAAGSLSFQGHVSHIEAASFKAPELLQGQIDDEQPDVSQMHVYSLGMTLYWSAEFHVPPNQPLQLGEPLHSLLLAMCEDQPCRRRTLPSVLEACRAHQKEVAVFPAPASLHVRRLVGLVLGTISEVERRVVEESSSVRQNRSYLLRKRLHQASSESPVARSLECLHPCRVSERSTETQSTLGPHSSTSAHSHCSFLADSALPAAAPQDRQEGLQLSSGSTLSAAAESTQQLATPSQRGFLQRKGKFSRPEFILLAGEAPVTLHLPGSVVTKKGKSYLALRDLCVFLLSGQCLEVKCDIESTAGAVFNAITSFANLGELTYFGLAYMKGKEFFFLDNETRLCKIAPEGWREQPQKTSTNTFMLFLRIKFFVSHFGLLRHNQTRHQFYLQLRRDVLEERLHCPDETLLQLAVLALQAEFGSYPKEQVESKAYFRVEDYIPASLIERMTALRVQLEVSEMHRLSSTCFGEDAELEFLRVTQQLPEYGVLIHRVFPEKKRPEGEMALGICAKGVIVYEVKSSSRIATLRFQWSETGKISTYRKKFTITSSITGKKHTFVTDSAKTCKYLLGLCSAQHGFNVQMGSGQSPQVLTDHNTFVQMANLGPAHKAPSNFLTWIQRLSCSEDALFAPKLQDAMGSLLSSSLDHLPMEASRVAGAEGIGGSLCTGREQLESICLIQKPMTCDPLSGPPANSVRTGSQNNKRKTFIAELGREIVCVTLNRDPHRGFGFVINEGEDVGQADPGIFISSIIPGGPAEKAKKIKPGGQILALNHISLEGFTFNMAVRMIQNSPDNIELIISQSKGVCGNTSSEEKNSMASSGAFSTDILSSGHLGSLSSPMQDQDRNTGEPEMTQEQSLMPGLRPQLSPLSLKDAGSSCLPLSEANASEIYFVELVKEDGTLGFSVTGGINTSVLYGGIYVKSIVPGGPAAREGQILQGDRLLQVDGVNLCGLTHKQAVQCLKGPGQIERESCSHLKTDLVRIKRLFPGQPAEENGAIAAGDIILAVNGRPTEGLIFQDVLHLLRGAPQEVTLLLCRPPPGVLPEMEQERQTPILSADKEFTRATCIDSELSPNLDQEDSWRDSASPDAGEGLGPRPESFQKTIREVQQVQDMERPRASSLPRPPESHPHLCKLHQETHASALATSLEKDVRQNCYSVCDIRRLGSPELDNDDEEGDACHPPEAPSATSENEEYLTINSVPEGQLPCEECLEADSWTIALPQFCSWCAFPESLPPETSHESDSDWEDLEEPMDPGDGALR